MAWLLLFLAGLLEVGWAVLLTVISMIASLGLLGLALRSLPLGTAYAIWIGVGTIGMAVLGIVLLGEAATAARLACIG